MIVIVIRWVVGIVDYSDHCYSRLCQFIFSPPSAARTDRLPTTVLPVCSRLFSMAGTTGRCGTMRFRTPLSVSPAVVTRDRGVAAYLLLCHRRTNAACSLIPPSRCIYWREYLTAYLLNSSSPLITCRSADSRLPDIPNNFCTFAVTFCLPSLA